MLNKFSPSAFLFSAALVVSTNAMARSFQEQGDIICNSPSWDVIKKNGRYVCDKNMTCIAFPFSDWDSNLELKFTGPAPLLEESSCGKRKSKIRGDQGNIKFDVLKNGAVLASFKGKTETYTLLGEMAFSDGEVWNMGDSSGWQSSQQAWKIRSSNADNQKNIDAIKAKEDRAVGFRSTLAPGAETSIGMVLEVKGDIVKVQVEQCTQRSYDGACLNYGHSEKWVKRNTIYPK